MDPNCLPTISFTPINLPRPTTTTTTSSSSTTISGAQQSGPPQVAAQKPQASTSNELKLFGRMNMVTEGMPNPLGPCVRCKAHGLSCRVLRQGGHSRCNQCTKSKLSAAQCNLHAWWGSATRCARTAAKKGEFSPVALFVTQYSSSNQTR